MHWHYTGIRIDKERARTWIRNKMRKSARPVEGQQKPENENQKEPNLMKSQSDDKIPNIVTRDNGTMVQVFKYFDYCQLATSSLVSKRFRNVIRTHRKSLALLAIKCSMVRYPSFINYGIRNGYMVSFYQDRWDYELCAEKDPNQKRTSISFGRIYGRMSKTFQPNRKTFQHFVRLLTDPFVFIHYLELKPQKDVLSLLAKAFSSERGRLQCGQVRLEFSLELQSLKFTSWIKDHVRCDELRLIISRTTNNLPNGDKQLLDFFSTGSHCTSVIGFLYLSKALLVGLVQKFMDLKNCDENQIVQSISGRVSVSLQALKNEYAHCLVTEKLSGTTGHVFEFANNDIGKVLELTFRSYNRKGYVAIRQKTR